MVPSRKYDSREARAQGSTGTTRPAALAGTGSCRYRNFGDCSTAVTTSSTPPVKSPPAACTFSSRACSAGASGRR